MKEGLLFLLVLFFTFACTREHMLSPHSKDMYKIKNIRSGNTYIHNQKHINQKR